MGCRQHCRCADAHLSTLPGFICVTVEVPSVLFRPVDEGQCFLAAFTQEAIVCMKVRSTSVLPCYLQARKDDQWHSLSMWLQAVIFTLETPKNGDTSRMDGHSAVTKHVNCFLKTCFSRYQSLPNTQSHWNLDALLCLPNCLPLVSFYQANWPAPTGELLDNRIKHIYVYLPQDVGRSNDNTSGNQV